MPGIEIIKRQRCLLQFLIGSFFYFPSGLRISSVHDNSFGKIKSSCKQLKSDSPVYVVLYSSAQSERLYLIRGGPKYRVCFQGRCHCRSRIKSVNGATSTHPMANSNHKSEISECVPAHIAPSEKDKLLKNTNTTSKTIH